MSVTGEQSDLYCLADFIGPGLPCAETNCRDLVPGIKGKCLPAQVAYEYPVFEGLPVSVQLTWYVLKPTFCEFDW